MKKIINFILIFVTFILVSGCSCNKQEEKFVNGVWWWNDQLDYDKYLTFASNYGINEIYYCNDEFNESTSLFIKKANSLGINVYWLIGDYNWLNDASDLYQNIEKYISYQDNYSDYKFLGIHLDIEPHQDPSFKTNRNELITNLIKLANNLKNEYPQISFDYDIPFWLNDEIIFNNVTLPSYAHMINLASRVFIMSYRDDASAIYDLAKEEIEYASSVNKIVILGVETKSNEGDNVSFQEEGKEYMYAQLEILKDKLPFNYGISIHQIKSWYDLKE